MWQSKLVAIKLLLGSEDDAGDNAAIEAEALLADVSHECYPRLRAICAGADCGTSSSSYSTPPALISDYMSGTDLASLLR